MAFLVGQFAFHGGLGYGHCLPPSYRRREATGGQFWQRRLMMRFEFSRGKAKCTNCCSNAVSGEDLLAVGDGTGASGKTYPLRVFRS